MYDISRLRQYIIQFQLHVSDGTCAEVGSSGYKYSNRAYELIQSVNYNEGTYKMDKTLNEVTFTYEEERSNEIVITLFS